MGCISLYFSRYVLNVFLCVGGGTGVISELKYKIDFSITYKLFFSSRNALHKCTFFPLAQKTFQFRECFEILAHAMSFICTRILVFVVRSVYFPTFKRVFTLFVIIKEFWKEFFITCSNFCRLFTLISIYLSQSVYLSIYLSSQLICSNCLYPRQYPSVRFSL